MIINHTDGRANIMGTERSFTYDHKAQLLTIRSISFAETETLLDLLERVGGGPIVSRETNPPKDEGGAVVDLVGHAQKRTEEMATTNGSAKKGALAVDPDKIKSLAASNPAKPPKAEKPKKAETKKPAEEEEVEVQEVTEVPPSSTHAVAQADDADDDEPPPAKKPNGSKIPEALKTAKKLRDVLTYLMDKEDMTDPAALKARCEELKDDVPCLGRIADLEARVERTLEVMDNNADIS